jgi:hypothetical protein
MRMIGIWLVAASLHLCAEDWTPKRIFAISEYVWLARVAHVYGEVEVRCFLEGDGTVMRAEAISGHPLLKEQARKNALRWKFQRIGQPGENNTVILKYRYSLEGESQGRDLTQFIVDLPNTIQIIAPNAPVMR